MFMSKRILIVDDDADFREMILHVLKSPQYEVVTADSGFQAVCALKGRRYDLILLDVMMPGMDGLMTIDFFKDSQPAAPIVVVTGVGDREVHREALKRGAHSVVEKPFDIDRFLTMVQDVAA
jgi:CheY-like chemotaxis protein